MGAQENGLSLRHHSVFIPIIHLLKDIFWLLPILAIMNKAAINVLMQAFVRTEVYHYKKLPNCLPKWLYHSGFPPATMRIPHSRSFLALSVMNALDFGHF